MRIDGLCLFTRNLEEFRVKLADIIIEKVAVFGVGLLQVSRLSERSETKTNCALVRALGVVEGINVKSVFGHLALNIFLLDDVFPQLLRIFGSWQATGHANDG